MTSARRLAPMVALASYKIATNYREFMTNDKLVADLRKHFQGYTCPPVNKGGVR
jgi:hypothetical protein